jgi:DNA-binding MarR family transcriptional regulator
LEYNPDGLKWLFRAFDRMHHNCLKAELKKRGLREASHPVILFALKHEIKDMLASQKEIADAIGISPPTAAISIKRMEKAGLLCKIPDEQDTRRKLITLTEKGIQLINECELAFEKVDQGMLTGFTAAEIEQLKMFYLRMINNLETMGAQPPAQLKRSI